MIKTSREYLIAAYGAILAILGLEDVLERIANLGWIAAFLDPTLQMALLIAFVFGESFAEAKRATSLHRGALALDALEALLLYVAMQAVGLVPNVMPIVPLGFWAACAAIVAVVWLQIPWRVATKQLVTIHHFWPRVLATVLLLLAAFYLTAPVTRLLLVIVLVVLVVVYDLWLRTLGAKNP